MAPAFAVSMGVTVATVLTPLCAICVLAGMHLGREVLWKRLSESGFEPLGVKLGLDPRYYDRD
jgi:hypothetical protein